MATIEVTENDLIAAILAASVPTPNNPHGALTVAQLVAQSELEGKKRSPKWIRNELKRWKASGKLGVTEILAESLNGRYQPISAYYEIKDK